MNYEEEIQSLKRRLDLLQYGGAGLSVMPNLNRLGQDTEIVSPATLKLGGFVVGKWQSYTPTWTAATTNPDIGDGTLLGYYRVTGKEARAIITMIAGASTTFGSGVWSISLPVNSYASVPNANQYWLGLWGVRDDSTGVQSSGIMLLNRNQSVITTAFPARFSATYPITWASGDLLLIDISYEIA